ncbi:partitioning protein ParA [Helicobacter fennelliae]|uniref:Partitioning protein ParA n=1 Tax=Helicobacter fennelliae TaxID=215 RepID=A0A2X3E289_9HELI|nr:ParA family protein [Helicobacter fennelliae]SQC36498.1 partitioning protein ParA [Helicobacter fennelliae]
MIIVVANEKGGSGKTTLALNLACFCAEDGDTITLIDADPQKSTETFSNNRSDYDLKPLFSNIFKVGSSLKDEINLQCEKNDGIIIDTGGRDSREMRIAISKADLLIIPTIASQLDVVVLEKMLEIFAQAKDINQSLKALIVFNKISPNPFLSKDIDELKQFVQNAIQENHLEDVFIADSMIYERRVYKKIVETGQTLREFCKENDKALCEFQNFFNEILNIMKLK